MSNAIVGRDEEQLELKDIKHIGAIIKALDIPESSRATVWKLVPPKNSIENGSQIDLVFDRDDDAVTLCEIKYTDQSFVITKEYAQKLLLKKEVFVKATKTKKQIFIAIISANGLKDNVYVDDMIDGVVTLDDLI